MSCKHACVPSWVASATSHYCVNSINCCDKQRFTWIFWSTRCWVTTHTSPHTTLMATLNHTVPSLIDGQTTVAWWIIPRLLALSSVITHNNWGTRQGIYFWCDDRPASCIQVYALIEIWLHYFYSCTRQQWRWCCLSYDRFCSMITIRTSILSSYGSWSLRGSTRWYCFDVLCEEGCWVLLVDHGGDGGVWYVLRVVWWLDRSEKEICAS